MKKLSVYFLKEKILQLSLYKQCLFSLMIWMILVTLGYLIFLAPLESELMQLSEQEAGLERELITIQREKKYYIGEEKRFKLFQGQVAKKFSKLPLKKQTVLLLHKISMWSAKNGLVFDTFTPEPERQHTSYTEVSIRIKLVGSFQALFGFLKEMTLMNQRISIHNISFSKIKNSPRKNPQLKMNLIIKVYGYKP